MNRSPFVACVILAAATCLVPFQDGVAAALFENATDKAGIASNGFPTFSVAWTDFDGDGFPDLLVSPHLFQTDPGMPQLFINNGNGTFTDQASSIFMREKIASDTHGASWADFDNDGDPDLLLSVGAKMGRGSGRNLFFVNRSGKLHERAKEFGLDCGLGRGRSALWFDLQKDGRLDTLMLNAQRSDGRAPCATHTQKDGHFTRASARKGPRIEEPARSAVLSDVTGDGKPDLLVLGAWVFPLRVYDLNGKLPVDVTRRLPRIEGAPIYPVDDVDDFADHNAPRDVAIADFNGDLHPDIFLTRSLTNVYAPQLLRVGSKALVAALPYVDGTETFFSFKTQNLVSFQVQLTPAFDPALDAILVGSGGIAMEKDFVLDPANPAFHGNPTPPPHARRLVSVGYDTENQCWNVGYTTPPLPATRLSISSEGPITDIQAPGFDRLPNPSANALRDVLLVYDPASKRYVDRTAESGLAAPTLCQSALAADFDNDMDVDIYLSCTGPLMNIENILYENQGNGTFASVPKAGGAPSEAVGPHDPDFGIGSRTAMADYDLDGFMDIFLGGTTWRKFALSGKQQGALPTLYRNLGNANNWLEIDLEGVSSNRDAVGARVVATTHGKAQLREVSGGTHVFGQNMSRIHFGMGGNRTVQKLEIHWPSGARQVFRGIPCNQLISIQENSADFSSRRKTTR